MSEDTVFPCKQLIGAAFLGDFAGSQDYDLISCLHSTHTMGAFFSSARAIEIR